MAENIPPSSAPIYEFDAQELMLLDEETHRQLQRDLQQQHEELLLQQQQQQQQKQVKKKLCKKKPNKEEVLFSMKGELTNGEFERGDAC